MRALPQKLLTLGLAATLGFLVFITWFTWDISARFERVSTEGLRLTRLTGTIVHLDEVLTMSARMAARTADPAWEARYRHFEPELATAIEQAMQLPAVRVRAAARTAAANDRLVDFEDQAFALVREGRLEEAAAILDGAAYLADKRVYREGIDEVREGIDQKLLEDRAAVTRGVQLEGLLALGSAVLLVIAWLRVFFTIRRHLRERDAAEERRLALELQIQGAQRLESLAVLAGGAAHDFNNLLTAILGNANAVRRELPVDHTAQPWLSEIIGGSRVAAHLTAQLLAYAGERPLRVRPLDLAAEVRGIEPVLRSSVRGQAQLELELAPELPAIEADAVQIHQVLMNLVLNAAQSSEAQVQVRVRTLCQQLDATELLAHAPGSSAEPGSFVVLEVSDDGNGMGEATRERVFDPFFTTKSAGHGLGLAATLGIVHGHGGAIRLESEPGIGTRFRVCFPASDAKPAESAAETDDVSGKGLVLVVDDEDFVLQAAYLSLESYGYSVMLADGGRSAIELFRERGHEIDLVILDVGMPDMSGRETLLELRKIQPDVKVVLSSGSSTGSSGWDASGADAVLPKPYLPEELAAQVRALLYGSESAPPADFEEALLELRASYRERLPQRIELLAEAVRAARAQGAPESALTEARRLAHMLKGTVGSYGFGSIAASLERIEEQLEAGDPGPDWPVVDAALARIDALLGA